VSSQELTKKKTFLYDMVTADVFGFRNVKRDVLVIDMQERLRESTGRDDGSFTTAYSQRVVYTDQMNFQWHEDVPQELRNLQEFWDMVQSGKDEVECYLYYIDSIPNYVTNAWQKVVDDSHVIWKPSEQRPVTANAGDNDPNSESAKTTGKEKSENT